jgi:hypothetical protein
LELGVEWREVSAVEEEREEEVKSERTVTDADAADGGSGLAHSSLCCVGLSMRQFISRSAMIASNVCPSSACSLHSDATFASCSPPVLGPLFPAL